jgi:hydrogenase maturation protease
VVLIDAVQRGGRPGDVSVIEPDFAGEPEAGLHTHDMNPLRVVQLLRATGATLPRILLVGCEPETFGTDEGHMGLSEAVAAAVPEALRLIQAVLHDLLESAAVPPGKREDDDS